MYWNTLGYITYIVLFFFPLSAVAVNVHDRIKHKNDKSVRVHLGLVIVCFLGSLVGLFGGVSNCVYMLNPNMTDGKYTLDDIGVDIILFLSYAVMFVILIMLHRERIIYPINGNEIFVSRIAHRKEIIKIEEITRVYLSGEYLDIYVGDRRIRYGNNFLTGAAEFESLISISIAQQNKSKL